MKLGKLNKAIDEASTVYAVTFMGRVALQKGSLKEALKSHFTEGRNHETGLMLDADSTLVMDVNPVP